MSGIVGMTMEEINRASVIQALVGGDIRPQVAALRLGLTTRQVQRLAERFRESGAVGLVSRQRGKASNRQLAPQLAQMALGLIRERYHDFSPTLACEKLMECHGLKLSKETVRQLMITSGLWKTRQQRQAPLHQPRLRRACFGDLVQIDGSYHPWFEERANSCTLLVFVDDATGRLQHLHFAPTESTSSYFVATRDYIAKYTKPVTFYADRAAVFRNNKATGRANQTQFHRALANLDIALICARTPQGKGRVERMNRTLQNRLVKELRLLGISGIDEANAMCEYFMAAYNRRFARQPRSELDLHRPLRPQDDPVLALSWHDQRKLSVKLTVQNRNRMYLLHDTPETRKHIGKTVAIYTYPDGNVELRLGGIKVAYTVQKHAPRANLPVLVDGKNLDQVLNDIRAKKQPQARHYRDLTAQETTTGVAAAKDLSAQKAVRNRQISASKPA